MMRNLRGIFRFRSAKFRAALFVGALTVLASVACSGDDPVSTATALTATATFPGGGNVLQLPNIADTVERVRPAVVSILTQGFAQGRRQPSFSSGTGVIFDESGLVLTNNHVVEGGVEITVTLDDGTQIVADMVGADNLSDLAVLRLPGDGYPSLPLLDCVPAIG